MAQYKLDAIGHVDSSATESQYRTKEEWASHESSIIVLPMYADGTRDLCKFCRTAYITFGIDRLVSVHLEAHPRGDKTREPRGCFSVSTPARPNHLGVTEVLLLGEETLDNGSVRIRVKGLDALNGSPVFDIKGASKSKYGEEESRKSESSI